MLIIDENLRSLVEEKGICSNPSLIDTFSLQVRLSNDYYVLKKDADKVIKYGFDSDSLYDLYEFKESDTGSIILEPGQQILACSHDSYKIPSNIFGLLQTKGSLARLFVQITCTDGQVEPGFEGKITLEIVNLSTFKVEIPFFSKVGQLYLFNCSMHTTKLYDGRYNNATSPTIPIFNGIE